jgi:hypothetical protein
MKRHTLLFKVTVDTAKDAPITQEQIEDITALLHPEGVEYPPVSIKDISFSNNVTADYDQHGMTLKEPE